jgi:hypothetical protein
VSGKSSTVATIWTPARRIPTAMPPAARAAPRQPPASAARRVPRTRPIAAIWASPEKKIDAVARVAATGPQRDGPPARRAAARSHGSVERPARKTRFPVMDTV